MNCLFILFFHWFDWVVYTFCLIRKSVLTVSSINGITKSIMYHLTFSFTMFIILLSYTTFSFCELSQQEEQGQNHGYRECFDGCQIGGEVWGNG